MSPKCELCGEPMPPGEEMFKYHGYSGPCPKVTPPAGEVERRGEVPTPLEAQVREAIAILEDGTDYERMHVVAILKNGLGAHGVEVEP